MITGVTTLITAQLFDFGTFVRMVERHGAAAEANPLVGALFLDFGLPMLLVSKIVLVAFEVSVVAVLAHQGRSGAGRVLAGAVLGTGIVAGLVGGLSNALTLV
jgi:hypothetical protein